MSGKYKKYIVSGDDLSEKQDEGGNVVNTDVPVNMNLDSLITIFVPVSKSIMCVLASIDYVIKLPRDVL